MKGDFIVTSMVMLSELFNVTVTPELVQLVFTANATVSFTCAFTIIMTRVDICVRQEKKEDTISCIFVSNRGSEASLITLKRDEQIFCMHKSFVTQNVLHYYCDLHEATC